MFYRGSPPLRLRPQRSGFLGYFIMLLQNMVSRALQFRSYNHEQGSTTSVRRTRPHQAP
jgi:hypothetical protein